MNKSSSYEQARDDLFDKLPRAQKCQEINYQAIPDLLDRCFSMWTKQINTKTPQSKGGEESSWYLGLLCYLRSLKCRVDEDTQVPSVVLGQTVPYKLRGRMVRLNQVFDEKEISAILTLM